MMQRRRVGAALVLALLVLLVLECVVVGTLHLTQLERRLAENGATALRLRLAAEAAARAAAGVWPPLLDTIPLGALAPAASGITADGLSMLALYQRIDSALVFVFGEAKEPAPRFGMARAALLIEPPLLLESMLPAAALTVGGVSHVRAAATVEALPDPTCPDSLIANALIVSSLARLQIVNGATITGNIDVSTTDGLWTARSRAIASLIPPPTIVDSAGRQVYAGNGSGVLGIDGDLLITGNATFLGVVIVTGSLTVESGARVDGIVLVVGDADIGGNIRFSRCVARAAIHAAALHRPRPHAARSVIPAF